MGKRPILMGILNVTPDSFSDGGRFLNAKKALKHAESLIKQGADIIDIGAESTGPGAKDVTLQEELKRVIPVLKELRKITNLKISIDTYKSQVALECLELGADMINDVTALRGDKNMGKVIAKYGCPIVLMYSKDNTPRTSIKKVKYEDIIKTITAFFEDRIKIAENFGIKRKNIIIDPGMGQFISSIPEYSYEIIARLKELKKFELPILLGASRKLFLGEDMNSREEKIKIIHAIAYLNGVSILRTHEVEPTKEFLKFIINKK